MEKHDINKRAEFVVHANLDLPLNAAQPRRESDIWCCAVIPQIRIKVISAVSTSVALRYEMLIQINLGKKSLSFAHVWELTCFRDRNEWDVSISD